MTATISPAPEATIYAALYRTDPEIRQTNIGEPDDLRAAARKHHGWTESWWRANNLAVLERMRLLRPRIVGAVDIAEVEGAARAAVYLLAEIDRVQGTAPGFVVLDIDLIAFYATETLRVLERDRTEARLEAKTQAVADTIANPPAPRPVGRVVTDFNDRAGRLLIPAGTFVEIVDWPRFIGWATVAVTDRNGLTMTVRIPREKIARP